MRQHSMYMKDQWLHPFARHKLHMSSVDLHDLFVQQVEAADKLNDEEEEAPGGCILAHSMGIYAHSTCQTG